MPHNYDNDQIYSAIVNIAGANSYRLAFDARSSTEYYYDNLRIYSGGSSPQLLFENSGSSGWNERTLYSETGLDIVLTTDYSITDWGVEIDIFGTYRDVGVTYYLQPYQLEVNDPTANVVYYADPNQPDELRWIMGIATEEAVDFFINAALTSVCAACGAVYSAVDCFSDLQDVGSLLWRRRRRLNDEGVGNPEEPYLGIKFTVEVPESSDYDFREIYAQALNNAINSGELGALMHDEYNNQMRKLKSKDYLLEIDYFGPGAVPTVIENSNDEDMSYRMIKSLRGNDTSKSMMSQRLQRKRNGLVDKSLQVTGKICSIAGLVSSAFSDDEVSDAVDVVTVVIVIAVLVGVGVGAKGLFCK